MIYSINKQIVHPLHANILIHSSGYCIQNILFYPLIIGVKGAQGLEGTTGAQGLQGATGDRGARGHKGRDGHGVPTGGFTGQILIKSSSDDYDTKWCFANQLRIDSVVTLEASVEFLITRLNHLECRYNLLSKNKFSKFNPDFLTYSTLLRSYMNLIAIFDGGNSTSDYSNGPIFDCGEGVEQFTDMIVITIDAGYAKSTYFSSREESIQYLEFIYPDEDERDIILDCGNSSTNYSICPLIDCGGIND
jgi:hypothetical protein